MRNCKHLAIRLSQPTMTRRTGPPVIEAHNAIVRERGECAFGKFGAQISQGTKRLIENQINDMEATYLYVILRRGSNVTAFRARIKNIVSVIGREESGKLNFPSYYNDKPASAIIISEELKESKIDELLVASSKRPLLDAILSSRTPLMLVNFSKNDELKGAGNAR